LLAALVVEALPDRTALEVLALACRRAAARMAAAAAAEPMAAKRAMTPLAGLEALAVETVSVPAVERQARPQ
jgi:hypothetical protein